MSMVWEGPESRSNCRQDTVAPIKAWRDSPAEVLRPLDT